MPTDNNMAFYKRSMLRELLKFSCTALNASDNRFPSTKQWLTVMFSVITNLSPSFLYLSQPILEHDDYSILLSGNGCIRLSTEIHGRHVI